jgi:hypothetical protein
MYRRHAYNHDPMSAGSENPVRATLIAILKQLNMADARGDGAAAEQALELRELEQRLHDFWAIEQGSAKVAQAVGLLLRNGMVVTTRGADYSWQRQREIAQRYQITSDGKKLLVDSLTTSDRIS